MSKKNNYLERLDTYNSYSGCDMTVTAQINSHYKIKNNVYTLGSLQTISISTHQEKMPVRSIGNINAKEYTMGTRTIAGSLVFAVFDKHFAYKMFKDSLYAADVENTILLPDELPPLDITISYANEYGRASSMRLYGVRLISEGQVMSINDIYTENTYQFVATGLEPLKREFLKYPSLNNNDKDDKYDKDDEDNNNENDADKILEIPDYDIDYVEKEAIELNIEIDQPVEEDDYGIVRFHLNPEQTNGKIKIHPSSSEDTIIYDIENNLSNSTHYVMLPKDNYFAYYENESKVSNTVSFSIYFNENKGNDMDDVPIVEFAYDDTISILSNSKEHKYAVCKELSIDRETATTLHRVEIKSKTALFKNLKPSTTYQIYTTLNGDDTIKSKVLIIKTLSSKRHNIDRLNDFVQYNSNLLKYELEDYFNVINNLDEGHNIIDLILKINPSDDKEKYIKDELLLFSIKLQNIINLSLNINTSINTPLKDLTNPFSNSFLTSKESLHCNIFRKERGKTYFDSKISYANSHTYEGKSNIKYIVNSTLKNNIRTSNYEFHCFDFSSIERLSNYKDSNILYTKRDDNKGMSVTNYDKVLAREYKKPSVPKLTRPNIEVKDNLDIVVKMSQYNEIVPTGKQLIIAISKVNECLDYTPHIKYVHIHDKKDLIIPVDISGLLYNESYSIWIEDIDKTQISHCETIDTYINDEQLLIESENITIKELEREVDKIINNIKDDIEISSELSNSIYSIIEQDGVHISNLYDKIIEHLIENKVIVKDIFFTLFKILSVKHKMNIMTTIGLTDKVIYDLSSSEITFDVESKYNNMSIIEIDCSNGSIIKDVLTERNKIGISNNKYTMLYKTKDNMTNRTGFILIDNASKQFLTYGLKVEVV